jgi:hypothetical protein
MIAGDGRFIPPVLGGDKSLNGYYYVQHGYASVSETLEGPGSLLEHRGVKSCAVPAEKQHQNNKRQYQQTT